MVRSLPSGACAGGGGSAPAGVGGGHADGAGGGAPAPIASAAIAIGAAARCSARIPRSRRIAVSFLATRAWSSMMAVVIILSADKGFGSGGLPALLLL